MANQTLKLIKESEANWVDLRFTDTKGKEQHVSIPSDEVNEGFFEEGKMFDGSSIAGWKGINESDMILMPDDETSVLDPFTDEPTVILRCGIVEPTTMQGYNRDPRSIAERAQEYMRSIGVADTVVVPSRLGGVTKTVAGRPIERRSVPGFRTHRLLATVILPFGAPIKGKRYATESMRGNNS